MSSEFPDLPPRWLPERLPPLFPDVHAQLLLLNYLFKEEKGRLHTPEAHDPPPKVTVGILGAGAAGLYSALLIDWLNDQLESQKELFRFDYEILEVEPERVGGRMYTYRFKSGKKYDYYDAGAMRFPDIPFMKRVFDLFEKIGLKKEKIPYVMTLDSNLNYFNGKCLTNKEMEDKTIDPFGTGVEGIFDSTSAMASQKFEPFKKEIKDDLEKGWKKLMKYDGYSTRGYMTLVEEIEETEGTRKIPKKRYSNQLVSYLETFESGANMYDQAFTEAVMESLTFDYAPDIEWYCIDGGTDQIATKMKEKIKGTVTMGARVTALAIQPENPNHTVEVSVAGHEEPRKFNHVITTLPFGCLRNVDTSGCFFSWNLQTAIRSLTYDCSTKVAIRFSSRWWEQDNLKQCGGVSSTDRPIRKVIYPSYGMNKNDGATIIVSYTWSQDATRMGSLVQGYNTPEEKLLVDLIIGDLAVMHGLDKEYLSNLVVDHHAHDWSHEPNSGGAFAFFGPSQFATLYPLVTQPVDGLLHFAGEATSVHHAWVVGALNSALRSVTEILNFYGRGDLAEKLQKKEAFGPLSEIPAKIAPVLARRDVDHFLSRMSGQ